METITSLFQRENLLPYRDYPNLTTLPIGSVHKVDGWGFLKHYGTDRLVISLEGKVYQAGENLEENVNQLKDLCTIKVDKVRANTSTKQKYAVCTVYEKGDWTVHADYEKVKILPKIIINLTGS